MFFRVQKWEEALKKKKEKKKILHAPEKLNALSKCLPRLLSFEWFRPACTAQKKKKNITGK